MKRIVLTALAVAMTVTAPAAYAQPGRDRDRDDHHEQARGNDHHEQARGDFHRHNEWRRGYHMQQNDWSRGERVDWRTRHLRRPPRGYEWRQVDGNYVMAAVATGIIASVIANSR